MGHLSWVKTSKPGWKEAQILSEAQVTTCFSRYRDKFYQAYRCWGGRSWFWRGLWEGPWGTHLARRARSRRCLLRMGFHLARQFWRRNVWNSLDLVQHRFQQLTEGNGYLVNIKIGLSEMYSCINFEHGALIYVPGSWASLCVSYIVIIDWG